MRAVNAGPLDALHDAPAVADKAGTFDREEPDHAE